MIWAQNKKTKTNWNSILFRTKSVESEFDINLEDWLPLSSDFPIIFVWKNHSSPLYTFNEISLQFIIWCQSLFYIIICLIKIERQNLCDVKECILGLKKVSFHLQPASHNPFAKNLSKRTYVLVRPTQRNVFIQIIGWIITYYIANLMNEIHKFLTKCVRHNVHWKLIKLDWTIILIALFVINWMFHNIFVLFLRL